MTRASLHRLLVAMASMLATATAHAQTADDIVRSADLGSGYARMLNLLATPDLTAARYKVRGDPPSSIRVMRMGLHKRLATLTPEIGLDGRMAAGYFRHRAVLPLEIDPMTTGTASTRWPAWSIGAGLALQVDLGNGWSIAPGIDLGVARLKNSTRYTAIPEDAQAILDNRVFNWKSDAWLATPGVEAQWQRIAGDHRIRLQGHVAWSRIASFSESSDVLRFTKHAGVYSLQGEYVRATPWKVLERRLDWVVFGGNAGFLGSSRDSLGFTSVYRLGAGLELPQMPDSGPDQMWRLSFSYLFGTGVRGATVGIGRSF